MVNIITMKQNDDIKESVQKKELEKVYKQTINAFIDIYLYTFAIGKENDKIFLDYIKNNIIHRVYNDFSFIKEFDISLKVSEKNSLSYNIKKLIIR